VTLGPAPECEIEAVSRMVRAAPPHGVVLLCRLGQSGVLLRGDGRTIAIDPFLSPHPDRAVPYLPAERLRCDLVLITHDHDDHLDPPTLRAILAREPACRVIAPVDVVPAVERAGVSSDRILGMVPGQRVEDAGTVVDAVAALHAPVPEVPHRFASRPDGSEYLGYVLTLAGNRIYHAGDTLWWEGLDTVLRAAGVDLALLPVNGGDAMRERAGMVGNLDPAEAVHLAAAGGARALVPLHYDMFAHNSGSPGQVAERAVVDGLPVTVAVLPLHQPFAFAFGDGSA
jgi:L-ascorbate 6-phosphate lactonase